MNQTRSSWQRLGLDAAVWVEMRAWTESLQRDIAAADAKAATLLGWSGTALALTATTATLLFPAGLTSNSWSGNLQLAAVLAGAAGLGLLTGCVVCLILAVRPNLEGAPTSGSLIGGGQFDVDDVVTLAIAATEHDDPRRPADRSTVLARIAMHKHQRIRAATTLLLACLPALAAGIALAIVAGVAS